jgi:DNA-binding CsgD family transcriptional regulator
MASMPSVVAREPRPPPIDSLPALGHYLGEADTFVALASRVCDGVGWLWGVYACVVALNRPGGGPAVLVDNLPEGDDSFRRMLVSSNVVCDPVRNAMTVPLMDPSGMIGSIRCVRSQPWTDEARRDLATVATQVSVRLAQLGIRGVSCSELTPRQYEAAALVEGGATNAEIAVALGISMNTVKKLLKDVFLRLGVQSRTELAMTLRGVAAPLDIPIGITRLGALTITRAP